MDIAIKSEDMDKSVESRDTWQDCLAAWVERYGLKLGEKLDDVSVALFLLDADHTGCFFVVQPQRRWREAGKVPFGCVGGKVADSADNETPLQALAREIGEELGPRIPLGFLYSTCTTVVWVDGEIGIGDPLSLQAQEPAVTAIKMHHSTEPGRGNTLIVCYTATLGGSEPLENVFNPSEGENPALIFLPFPLLNEAISPAGLRVAEVTKRGGNIIPLGNSNLGLTGEEMLQPLATPALAYKILASQQQCAICH